MIKHITHARVKKDAPCAKQWSNTTTVSDRTFRITRVFTPHYKHSYVQLIWLKINRLIRDLNTNTGILYDTDLITTLSTCRWTEPVPKRKRHEHVRRKDLILNFSKFLRSLKVKTIKPKQTEWVKKKQPN